VYAHAPLGSKLAIDFGPMQTTFAILLEKFPPAAKAKLDPKSMRTENRQQSKRLRNASRSSNAY